MNDKADSRTGRAILLAFVATTVVQLVYVLVANLVLPTMLNSIGIILPALIYFALSVAGTYAGVSIALDRYKNADRNAVYWGFISGASMLSILAVATNTRGEDFLYAFVSTAIGLGASVLGATIAVKSGS